jgi:hypothetical protein
MFILNYISSYVFIYSTINWCRGFSWLRRSTAAVDGLLADERAEASCFLPHDPLVQKRIYVVCTSEKVDMYVREKSWSMSVSVLKDASLTNAGDALRELDSRDLVKSDPFILLFGDVVTNVNVTQAIQAHTRLGTRNIEAI